MNKFLKIMNINKIRINIITLCVGFKLNYLVYGDFKNYSLISILDDEDITEALKHNFFESRDKNEFSDICISILNMVDTDQKAHEIMKWLFVCLKYARNTIINKQALLQKISEIYADFNYPPSMEGIIYYLPSHNYDSSKYTLEENRARLIELCDEYLCKLYKMINCKQSVDFDPALI